MRNSREVICSHASHESLQPVFLRDCSEERQSGDPASGRNVVSFWRRRGLVSLPPLITADQRLVAQLHLPRLPFLQQTGGRDGRLLLLGARRQVGRQRQFRAYAGAGARCPAPPRSPRAAAPASRAQRAKRQPADPGTHQPLSPSLPPSPWQWADELAWQREELAKPFAISVSAPHRAWLRGARGAHTVRPLTPSPPFPLRLPARGARSRTRRRSRRPSRRTSRTS